jgi:UDP-3-O-[3-hydroxymyristoyl] glucosamine N-acyltransferase
LKRLSELKTSRAAMNPSHFDIHDIFEFYQRISNARVLMTFKGAFSQELLVQIGELVKLQQGNNSKVQKMFSVFVEMAQNILYYSAEKEIRSDGKEVGVGMIIIRENEKSFVITSGNAIEKKKLQRLENTAVSSSPCRLMNSKPCIKRNALKNPQKTAKVQD